MADSDKDVLITPNTSQTSQPEVKFVGKDNSPMYLKVLDDNTLSFEGTEGQVFSISPTMSSGDIFSVNDISGIQSIAVNADGTVALAPVSGNVGIGKDSSLTAKLHINTSGSTDALRVDVDSSDDPDASPFVIAEDGRVGIGTASPVSDMALTLNGDGTSYEGIAFQVGGSTKWKMSTDSTSMYVDAVANGMDWTWRLRDGSGTLRPQLRLDGGAQAVIIGDDGDGDSDPGAAMNKLQINVGTTDGVQDFNDGILIVNNDTSIATNDIIGGIGFDTRHGNVPSRTLQASVALIARAREAHGTSDKGGYLDFYYSPTNQDDDTDSRRGMRFLDGKLSVGGAYSDVGDPINALVVEHTGADWHNGVLILRDDSSISSGDLLGAIGFDGKDGNNPSNVLEASAGIASYASQDHSTADKGGHLTFFTSPNDQADDTTSIERMRIRAGGTIEFKDDNANKTVKIHADTNSSPAPRLEFLRGTHDTWGSGDNYTDWRLENSNDLVFYSGFSSQSSGAAVERFRIHSDADGITVNGNVKSDSKSSFNTMAQFYYQRTSMGTGTVDMRVPPGGDGEANPNSYPMPRAGKVMAFSLHYYGSTITTNSGTDTWRLRKFNGGTETTLDVDVARTSLTNPNSTNYTTIVELASPLTVAANDVLAFKRQTNGGSVTHVGAILYVSFDL